VYVEGWLELILVVVTGMYLCLLDEGFPLWGVNRLLIRRAIEDGLFVLCEVT